MAALKLSELSRKMTPKAARLKNFSFAG
jgi:hypothetical protein